MQTTGTASRGLSVFFRLFELACGAIVLGLLGRIFYLIDDGGSDINPRLIYTAVIAGLTIIISTVLLPPLAYSFWLFPLDFVFFAAWLAVFVILELLTGINTCNSYWYNTYWGYYWGRWYTVAPVGVNINWSGCSAWRTVLAFSFIACILFLFSGFLGIYWTVEHGRIKERRHTLFRRRGRRGAATTATTGGVTGEPITAPAAEPGPTATTATAPV